MIFGRLTALLVAVTFLGGCEVNRETERERAIKAEQELVSEYSRQIPRANELQDAFISAWEEANEIKDLNTFRESISAKVIPALNSYHLWLEAMAPKEPAEGEEASELRTIHMAVVEGYKTASSAFERFAKGLDESNIEERYRLLMEAMNTLAREEEQYTVKLKEHYAQNRVILTGEAAKIAAQNEPKPEPAPEPAKSGGH